MILLFLFLMFNGSEEVYLSNEADNTAFEIKLEKGVEAFYKTDWETAREYFNELRKDYPEDPRPCFFESMMPFWEYFLVEQTPELAGEFLKISEKAVELSQKRLDSSPNDTTMVLLLSGLHGYRSLVAAGESNYRVAISSGMTGFNFTRQLLSIDSDRPDARIGRGMFYYMAGSIPRELKWAGNMMGLRGDIEQGFDELKKAASDDSYIRNDAKMMLMYLYHKEERYEEALEYAALLTETLPDNVIFKFKKAEIYESLEEHEEAIKIYTEIIEINNISLESLIRLSGERKSRLEKLSFKN